MREEHPSSSHDSQGDRPTDHDVDRNAAEPRDNRGTAGDQNTPTGAGREANPYDKMPAAPQTADGEVF